MSAQDFSWASVLERASGLNVTLTGYTQALILDALSLMRERWRWAEQDQYDDIDAAVSKAFDEIMRESMLGMIVFRAGPPADNELVCDGAQHLRADYPELYDILSPALIIDADTFRTPKLTNRFITGVPQAGIGSEGGSPTATLTVDNLPPHTHQYVPPTLNIDIEGPGVPDAFAAGVGLPTSTGSTGSATPFSILPPYSGVLPCLICR